MKKCPLCAEEIQEEAVKCRFCGEFIKKIQKWYYQPMGMIILFVAIGPFALPVVWFNPSINRKNKILISIIVALISTVLGVIVNNSVKNLISYYSLLFSI